MSQATKSHVVNGIDIAALKQTIAAVEADPAQGQTRWSVSSRWVDGARADHEIRGVAIGGESIDRTFTLRTDEPVELHGTNEYANPQEYLMAALNACMMVGYVAVAGLMGIQLTSLQVELEGEIDLRGFLGLDPEVKPGYDNLRQTVRIAGDGTPEQFAELHDVVRKTSPNYFNVTTAIPTRSEMIVE